MMAKIIAHKNGTKKDVIIKKAALLFRKKGFASTSMRELAENIGVEASSLYNHIGSKNELLQSICFKVANDFISHINIIENEESTSVNKIKALLQFHIHMMLDLYDEVYVANHEWKQMQEPFLSNFLIQRKLYESRFATIIKNGIVKKELKNIHPQVVVFTMLSAVRGLEYWQGNKKEISINELEKNMTEQLLNGIIK
jgi:AcrR family transcriptional regulator